MVASSQSTAICVSSVCIYDVHIDYNTHSIPRLLAQLYAQFFLSLTPKKALTCDIASRIPLDKSHAVPTPMPTLKRVLHVAFHYKNPNIVFIVRCTYCAPLNLIDTFLGGTVSFLERWELQNKPIRLNKVFNPTSEVKVSKEGHCYSLTFTRKRSGSESKQWTYKTHRPTRLNFHLVRTCLKGSPQK